VDSLSLPPEYYQKNDLYSQEGKIFLAGYNYKTHSIDIFSLTDREISKHIILDKDGPYKVNEVLSLKVISPDSILLADNLGGFSIIDSLGNSIWKLKRGDPQVFEKIPEGSLHAHLLDFQPGYVQSTNTIILHYIPSDKDVVLKSPFLISIGVKDRKASLVPIYYPTYNKKGYMPQYTGPQACYTEDKIVINYSFSSDIHYYDHLSGKSYIKGGRSNFTDNYLESMEENENPSDFMLRSIYFFKFTYDPYKELFYRVHWGEMPLRKADYIFNTFYDKPVFLTVFDKDFNYLYETRLEIKNGIVPDQLFPLPEGLLIFPYKQDTASLAIDRLHGYLVNFNLVK
jgi:hypothetical protein